MHAERNRTVGGQAGKWIGWLIAVSLAMVLVSCDRSQNKEMESVMKSAKSKDGTTIAYEQSGAGPVVVVVSAALADRSGTTRLAKHLAEHYTVVNYDRRGREKSTDTKP